MLSIRKWDVSIYPRVDVLTRPQSELTCKTSGVLLALVPILSQSFLTLMRCHFMAFFLFTVWHNFFEF